MPKISKRHDGDTSAAFSSNVVVRKYRNQTIVSAVTRPRKSNSTNRKKVNDKFKDANQWAKKILEQPEFRSLYEKGVNSRLSNPHTVAVSDYLVPPVIHYINLKEFQGKIGDIIRIKATDNFRVKEVYINILDPKGKQIENGYAVQYPRKPSMWIYQLTAEYPDLTAIEVCASARDLPGNVAEMSVRL